MSVELVRLHWPTAERVRYVGRCPVCNQETLWFFVLPEFDKLTRRDDGVLMEQGGDWCTACGFDGATRRPVNPPDLGEEAS